METDLIIVREYCQKSHVDPSFIVSLEEDGLIDIREVDGDIRLFDSLTNKPNHNYVIWNVLSVGTRICP